MEFFLTSWFDANSDLRKLLELPGAYEVNGGARIKFDSVEKLVNFLDVLRMDNPEVSIEIYRDFDDKLPTIAINSI